MSIISNYSMNQFIDVCIIIDMLCNVKGLIPCITVRNIWTRNGYKQCE